MLFNMRTAAAPIFSSNPDPSVNAAGPVIALAFAIAVVLVSSQTFQRPEFEMFAEAALIGVGTSGELCIEEATSPSQG